MLERDSYLNARWVVTPSFGFGIFDDGPDIELGSELEFRSGVVVAYQFVNKVRLGLGAFHLSNGGISDTNPGTEPAFISVAVPF